MKCLTKSGGWINIIFMVPAKSAYLAELARRAKESHVYRKYQLLGLEIAAALHDERHKSLYIKLAKERGGEQLLRLAKDVAQRRDVRNHGAYFMTLVKASSPRQSIRPPRRSQKINTGMRKRGGIKRKTDAK